MTKPCRALSLLALAVLATTLPGCGAAALLSTPLPSPSPTPQRSIIGQGSQSNVPPTATSGGAAYVVVIQISGTSSAGAVIEGTVDWTFASNPVAIAWGRGNCVQNPSCELISQNITTSKPKTVSAVNVQAGAYSLIIANLGTTNESISYQIALTQ